MSNADQVNTCAAQDVNSRNHELAQKEFVNAIRKQRDDALEKVAQQTAMQAVLTTSLKEQGELTTTLRKLLKDSEAENTLLHKRLREVEAAVRQPDVSLQRRDSDVLQKNDTPHRERDDSDRQVRTNIR